VLVLKIIHLIVALGVIVGFLLQSGKSAGLSGAIDGGASQFFGKQKGLDEKLSKLTTVLAIIFMITFLWSGVVCAQTLPLQLEGGEDIKIESIRLIGLRVWSEEDVYPILRRNNLEEGAVMPPPVLSHRVDRALNSFGEEGLFSDVRARIDDGQLIFEFEEYPRIVNIELKNNEAFDDQRLRDVVLLQRGEAANPFKIKQARRDIRNYYNQMGYSDVTVTSEVKKSRGGRAVVVFKIDETTRREIAELVYEFVDAGLIQRITRRWGLGWSVPIKEGDPYSSQRIQMARQAIKNWYYNRGHMEVTVKVYQYSVEGEGVAVRFEIEAGPVYRLGEVEFKNNELFTSEQLREKIPLDRGDVFNQQVFIEGLQQIEHAYQDRGYSNAAVLSPELFQIMSDPDELMVNVDVDVREGQPFYVERIEIYGNKRTYDKVIRREINLNPGDLLDGQKIRNAQRRLRNLGYFKSLEFNVDPGMRENTKIIRVRVEEGPTGQLQFGGGYSSSVGFVGNFKISKDNFSLYDYDEAFTGRGQSLSTNLQFGSEQDKYSISWDDPWFNDNLDKPNQPSPDYPIAAGWSGFSIENERDEGYNESRRGGAIRIGREFGAARSNKIDLEFSYRIVEVTQLDTADTDDVPHDIWSEWENTGKEDDGFERKISSVELGLQRDRRDHRLYPSSGYFIRGSVEYAGGVLGGNADYYLPRLDVRGYLPFWGPLGWALRVNYRTIDTWKDAEDNPIPSFEKFYLGGYNNVRGYEYRDIRVYGEVGDDVGNGGNSAAFSSLELRAQLIEDSMQFFLFGDVGRVYEEEWQLDGKDMYRSAGMGFRIFSPIGPMILSWATRLDETYPGADDAGETQVDFNIGGAF